MFLRGWHRVSARLCAVVCGSTALLGCSSPEKPITYPAAAIPAVFSKYCTGVLKVEVELYKPTVGEGWVSDGRALAAPGTEILLEVQSGADAGFHGYAFDGNGVPRRIVDDVQRGMTTDKHFTTDCALASDPGRYELRRWVLLAPATFYPTNALTGTPCRFDAGTEFTERYLGGGGDAVNVTSMTSVDLQAKCGFSKGFTNDLIYGVLLPR